MKFSHDFAESGKKGGCGRAEFLERKKKENKTVQSICLSPPKICISKSLRGWSALLLALTDFYKVALIDILRHSGRSGKGLAEARRLLIWAFLEVSDVDEEMSISWLEQCLALRRRTILECLKGPSPEEMSEFLELYRKLMGSMGPDDVREVVRAGLLGDRKLRVRPFRKGFLKSLGLDE